MAFKQKTWKDRLTEYPARRQLTKTDGSTEIVEVSRLEGTVSQEGDAFSAENMNDLEQRIADELDSQNKTLANILKYELIAETASKSSTNTVSVDLNNYSELVLYMQITEDNKQIVAETRIPVSLFKTLIGMQARYNVDSGSYVAYCKYIDDNNVILYSDGTKVASLYGIF